MIHAAESVGPVNVKDIQVLVEGMCVLNNRGQIQELVQATTVLPKPGLTVTQDASRFTKAA
jgi:hypothetical protein